MKRIHPVRPQLETLEDRLVPATTRLFGSLLLVSNQNGGLTVTQTAQNQFKVQDSATTSTTYSNVSSINITGSNLSDPITVNLSTFAYTGSLFVNSGNGNDVVSVFGTGNSSGVLGNTTIMTGLGNDTVYLNDNGAGTVTTGFRFGGSVAVHATANGTKTVNFGNATTASTIGGDISVIGFNNVNLGVFTTAPATTLVANRIGGNVSVQDSSLAIPCTVYFVDGLSVGKSVTVNTGSNSDLVRLDAVTVTGNTTVNLGNNAGKQQDFLFLGQFGRGVVGSQSPALFGGNVTVNQGSGIASIRIATAVTVSGDLDMNLGDGDNNEVGDSVQPGFVVDGSVNITAGNGNNNIGLAAIVAGNINITLGNSNAAGGGNSTFINYAPAGRLTYHSGNGPDFLGLLPESSGQVWNVFAYFGSNDDIFDLLRDPSNPATATLNGIIDGGGNMTGNMFLMDPSMNWSLLPNLTVTNFP